MFLCMTEGSERLHQSSGVWGKIDETGQFLKLILNILIDNISGPDDNYNLISGNVIHLCYYHIRSCEKLCEKEVTFFRTLRDNKPHAHLINIHYSPPETIHCIQTENKELRHPLWQGEDGRRGILWFNSNHSSRYTVTAPLQIYNQPRKKNIYVI